MNDFDGLLTADFGFKPQGKSAPMKPSSSAASTTAPFDFDLGSRSSRVSNSDHAYGSKPNAKSQTLYDFGDLFANNARSTSGSESRRGDPGFDFDSMFNSSSKSPGSPVYDKPVYDDDIFEGVPGMKSSSEVKYEDVFRSISESPPRRKGNENSGFDDLLGGFGKKEGESKSKGYDRSVPAFDDDLIPGFGGSGPPAQNRPMPEPTWSSEPTHHTSKTTEDPFVSLGSTSPHVASSSGLSTDPLEEFSKLGKSESMKTDAPSVSSGGVYDDMDPFDGLGKPVPSFSSERTNSGKDRSPLRRERSSKRSPDNYAEESLPVDNDLKSDQTFSDIPPASRGTNMSAGQTASDPSYAQANPNGVSSPVDMSPRYEENVSSSDEVWLTVSEIPLFTQPTIVPPPSRPPPPRPARVSRAGSSSFGSANVKNNVNEFSSFPNSTKNFEDPKSVPPAYMSSASSPIDELEDFAMGRNRNNVDDHSNGFYSEEMGMNSDAAASAAAMKEAMERAEAKFRHAKEVRERESSKTARSRDTVHLEKDEDFLDAHERALLEKQENLDRERLQREKEEEERERRRLEKEREREEKEREQRRLEKERERREIERERARQAVERATREARERAAAEARERAAMDARMKSERAAVEKVNAEARGRAERAAVLRAQAEARERAAAEARERAEKAAAEARDREARGRAAETRMKAERAAVERAAAEARERAAAEAREKAARVNQQKNDNDLEAFFSMGRASSAPRPRANSADPFFETQSQSRKGPDVAKTSESASSSMRKASSSTNIVDDLSSIFGGGVASSGEFPEVEGESEERRRARLDRHQRAQERAAKALAEKNQRDLQVQREQAERHRIGETLDVEIKRWAAGKEGNLRALLSTMQYVLWPECGWQPVSLTDLITAVAVKKVYRKATLCIHPDKVQQKGASLQQKYVAEKVFDLLKEAWNKFNSEELF
ncbi:auxilin-related protein 2-like [Rhodamnia argentea]|uniref:Auxilin-related protein 2-like n=1 Tax=Rhodamnia argentea TaxID=178133 RepID=A0A8B8MQA2_9MYRT|nr:auxilin-related protein 2-like [Rhodamnia argentea]